VRRHERRACLASDAVLINYESVRRLLGAAFGPQAAARCLHVPYSCEAAFCAPSEHQPPPVSTRPHVVALSRHDGRKGLDILLRALALLRRDRLSFSATLVGGGRLLEEHRKLARHLDLAEAVRIIGFVDDPRPWLAAADVFVLPSLEEGGGALSLLEALSAGVAVVASDIDGVPEDITHGQDGLLVPPADPPALAAALRGLITDPSRRQRLAAAGKHTFERRFSARLLTDTLAEIYERAAAPGQGPSAARRPS
jgi:glycosyltransferase involved in cell wall biosynthesis